MAAGCGAVASTLATAAPTIRPANATSIPDPYIPTDAPATPSPPAATRIVADAPTYPVACTAEKNANQGNWGAAQTHWGNAEDQALTANDGTGVQDYHLVGDDSGNIALDKLDGASKATINNDIATYHSDLAQVNSGSSASESCERRAVSSLSR